MYAFWAKIFNSPKNFLKYSAGHEHNSLAVCGEQLVFRFSDLEKP